MSLSVPMAIVIAGVMVAGAVYFSNRTPAGQNANAVDTQNVSTIQTGDFNIAPISGTDYVRGNPDAKVVMVEYSDTECPYCKQFHLTVKNLVNTFSKDSTFAWAYRNFPIKERHPKAVHEAEALLCAGKLGGQNAFWNYTDKIYEITPSNNGLEESQLPVIAKQVGLDVTAFNTCLASGEMTARVNAETQEAVNNGGGGTPYSILVTSKEYDKKAVEAFLVQSILKYKFPPDFFLLSNDNTMIGVSGSMPEQFMADFITLLAK